MKAFKPLHRVAGLLVIIFLILIPHIVSADSRTPIMGTAELTKSQLLQYLTTNNPDLDSKYGPFTDLVFDEAQREGVRADVAFVQMMKETNFLKFGHDVQAGQNNYGGIGATGNGEPGHSFPDMRTGIRAVIQHLKAYATSEPLHNPCVDPRYKYVPKGSAPYVEWLGQNENPQHVGWATDPGYGYDIVSRISSIKDNFKDRPYISSISHCQKTGWQTESDEGIISGTTGQALRMEAIKIRIENAPPGMTVSYQAHVENQGWQNWVQDGSIAGTTGQGLRMEALRIKLAGAPAGYHIQYQAHVENLGWQNWVQDGSIAGTTGRSLRLEAIRIKLIKNDDVGVRYQTHVENIGWQNYAADSQTAGTTGQALRAEAIKINLVNPLPGMAVQYQAHVQGQGWQDWVTDGQIAGTTGQCLRIEAIRIKLVGAPPGYHIQYQAHIQGIGWQGWVEDGSMAGTTGQCLRLEAIRIRIVRN